MDPGNQMQVTTPDDPARTATPGSGASAYLMVPMFIFFGLLIFAVIRGPSLISSTGIGSAVIVVAPLILATYALTIVVMAGRAGVDLSIGPLIGFINVGMIQLFAVGFMESPIAFFLYAIGVGIAYQILQGLIIIFVRVQPIIVSLSGYLTLVGLNLIILPRPGGVAPDWMFSWGSGTTIFSATLVILILATVAWYIIARTAFFGHLRLMGSDERAAYTSGVHINLVRLGAHIIGGVYAGLAAITFTALISSGDPTQGTTYTLMAVTALVLGGANLAGGRGSAFGSLLGALNIYLITYVLSTFNFGMVQSFVTDLAYGVMLVVSLLISLTVPQIQKRVRNLSPLVFFVILAVIALGVIMHTSMDQVIQPLAGLQSSAIVILSDGGVAQVSGAATGESYSPGTYVLFIVIGVVAAVYAFRVLFKYPGGPMVAFMVVVAVVALGLIFDPDPQAQSAETDEPATVQELDSWMPEFLAMEKMDETRVTPAVAELVSHSAYVLLTLIGTILLASLIILVMLPHVTVRAKRIALVLFAAAAAVIAVGALFFESFEEGYLASSFSGEIHAIILVGVALFTLTAPLVHNRLGNISNVFIILLGALALVCVYFFTDPVAPRSTGDAARGHSPAIFAAPATPQPSAIIEYAEPVRVNTDTPGIAIHGQLAFCAAIIVLLHIFLYIAMGESSFRSFWRLWEIPVMSALIWGGLFYASGVPLWQIVAVVAIAAISAPNVLHIISTYKIRQKRDRSISQWAES